MATPRILGLPFDSGVDAQVKIRQKQLSVRNRLNNTQQQDNLVVFNSSTSFVRLSSAVSVDSAERLATLKNNLGISEGNISGYNLAKNLVLWGGVNIKNLPRGIGYDLNSTYGFLSDETQGLKPLPGITSMTSNYKNNGSLREVTLNIKCSTRKQFEAIEAVYLRLGYTMVVEWGHTDYFLNDGIKSQTTGTSILNILYPGTKSKSNKIDPNTIQIQLDKNKKNTNYNYDGALFRVTNFSWTLNSDLSYDIVLYLITWGDIIDSLKLNTANSVINGLRIDSESSKGIPATLVNTVNNKSLNSLNTLFYQMYEILVKDRLAESGLSQETIDSIEDLDDLETQKDQIPEAKKILTDIVNEYLSLTEQYYNTNAQGITDENLDSLTRFKTTLTNLNTSINALNDLTSFQNLTGYSPSEIINGVEEINGRSGTVTVVDVSVGAIKTNILKTYQTQRFNTAFQNYIEDDIEPAGYRIDL